MPKRDDYEEELNYQLQRAGRMIGEMYSYDSDYHQPGGDLARPEGRQRAIALLKNVLSKYDVTVDDEALDLMIWEAVNEFERTPHGDWGAIIEDQISRNFGFHEWDERERQAEEDEYNLQESDPLPEPEERGEINNDRDMGKRLRKKYKSLKRYYW